MIPHIKLSFPSVLDMGFILIFKSAIKAFLKVEVRLGNYLLIKSNILLWLKILIRTPMKK
jgi:hypothetical protein